MGENHHDQTVQTPARRVAVLFSDISGSTALYRSVGDAVAERLIGETVAGMKDVTQRFDGHVLKTIGDAVMCRFESSGAAIRAAIDMQRQSSATPVANGKRLRLRIGFAFGTVIEREGDVFGDVVNIAARLSEMARAGQILSNDATIATVDDPDLRAATRLYDRTPVKGIEEDINVVQVIWERRNQTTLVPVMDVAKTLTALRLSLSCREHKWTFAPEQLPIWLGRGEDCELIIPAGFASRRHARLEYRRGTFMLVDESSNGTYVEVQTGSRTRVVFVRNEVFALVGAGRFALGARPQQDDYAVAFQC
jgi:class 3 adenylate cyclase